jgi:hypothetical protein
MADDFSSEQWNDLVTRCHECLENLESILRQANMRELETVGDVKTATNISDGLLLKKMFMDWQTFQDRLAQGIQKKSPVDVRQTLEPWLRRNKEFMKQLLVETQERVEQLRPVTAG